MLSHIRDDKMPKEAWENVKKIFAANTTARKLLLRQELNNIRIKDMFVLDYTINIKIICHSLGSVNINVDKDEMVQVCLGSLAQWFDPIRSAILGRENPPSFFDVLFGKEGKNNCIKNVLHVPTITKNLVSVGQIVEQGM